MCEAVTAALMIASMVMGKVESDRMQEENQKSAAQAYQAQMEALQLQRKQIDEQSSEKMSDVARQEQARHAQLRVAAGESGVSGISVDNAAGEITLDAAEDIVSLKANRNNAMKQSTAEAAGIAASNRQQGNSVRSPGWGQVALQIGATASSAYNKSQTKKPNTSGSGISGIG
jgi:hypothetical protein